MIRQTRLVYGVLAAVWVMIIAWQVVEHHRVTESAKTDLRGRAKEIANTLSAFIRGLQFRGAVIPERLEPVLNELVNARTNELVKSGELISIALLNAAGERIAEGGRSLDLGQKDIVQEGERWGRRSVTLGYPVDLGASVTPGGVTNPTVVLPPRRDFTNSLREGGRGFPRREPRTGEAGSSNAPGRATATAANRGVPDDHSHGPEPGPGGPPSWAPPPPPGPQAAEGGRRRPWWARRMDEKEYQSLIEKRALHGLVLAMSTETMRAAAARDLWVRSVIAALASVSVVGLGLAWRSQTRSSELEVRLVRAAELNSRLKDMNLAAAGLAHETKNPLNIVRGLAQMISKQEDTSEEIRQKTREIILETDRVTVQLNDFINFSRPREVHRSAVALSSVVGEVVRALSYDLEEKAIRLQIQNGLPGIEADEQLLRQALFNLLLNAIQAVAPQGEIQVVATKRNSTEAILEIRDNGPGVPPEHRTDIFAPYFTTNQHGTGLGLAVVQQIVLAHGWEIECLPNEPRGAIFRITHLKLAAKS